jgi:dihydroneopterin aldolase
LGVKWYSKVGLQRQADYQTTLFSDQFSNMAQTVRQSVWDAQLALSGHCDKIMVQNLEITVNAGKDVWGREKVQRALISITVTLGQKFASASTTDTVDASTIHYGILSKAIQARLQTTSSRWAPTAMLSTFVAESVREVAGTTPVYAIETDVCYVKGGMFGDGAGHRTSTLEGTKLRSSVLYLRNVRIPCLIGVNPNERLQKQPVVVNLWVECLPHLSSRADNYPELETFLFSVCLWLKNNHSNTGLT